MRSAGEQSFVLPVGEQLVQLIFHGPLGHLQAEVVGGDILDRVGLVENHGLVIRQQVGARLSQRQVAEEQGVIDDQDLGRIDSPPRLEVKTPGVIGAAFAQAIAGVALDGVPHSGGRCETQIGPAAIDRLAGPLAHLDQLLRQVLLRKQRQRFLLGVSKSPQAEVIAAPLHQRDLERFREHRLQKGNVLLNQLFLQVDRVGGNDDAIVFFAEDRLDGRHEVGERLADAGAGLDQQMPFAVDGVGDGVGHLHLLGPALEVGPETGNRAARAKDGGGVHGVIIGGAGAGCHVGMSWKQKQAAVFPGEDSGP